MIWKDAPHRVLLGTRRPGVAARLDAAGFDLEQCSDAMELLEAFTQEFSHDDPVYACIVADLDLPGYSGLELLKMVRTFDPHIPFILVAHETPTLIRQARRLSAKVVSSYELIQTFVEVAILDRRLRSRMSMAGD